MAGRDGGPERRGFLSILSPLTWAVAIVVYYLFSSGVLF